MRKLLSSMIAAASVAALTMSSTTAFAGVPVASGNQVNAPIAIPVNVCGVAIAALGSAAASCAGGAAVTSIWMRHGTGTGRGGISVASGNEVNAPVSVPVNVCGASVALFGRAAVTCRGGATVTTIGTEHPGGPPRRHHPKRHSIITTPSSPLTRSLPTTGVNLAGILAAALGSLGAGAFALLFTRRRQTAAL